MAQKPDAQDAEILAAQASPVQQSHRTNKAKASTSIDLPASAVSDITPHAEAVSDAAATEKVATDGGAVSETVPMAATLSEATTPDNPTPESIQPKAAPSKLVPGLIGLVAGAVGGFGAYQAADFLPLKTQTLNPAFETRLAAIEQGTKASPSLTIPPALLERIAKAEAGISEAAKREAALKDDIAKLAARPAATGLLGTVAPESTAEIERLKGRIGSMETSAKAVPEAIGALAAKGEAITGRVEALTPRLDDIHLKVETLAPKLGAMSDQMSALTKTVAAVSGRDALAQASSLVAAASVLSDAVTTGGTLTVPLGILKNLGVGEATLAVFAPFAEKGTPNAAALLAEFRAVQPKPVADAKPSPYFMERLKTGALSLIEVRKTGDITGTDDAAHLARTEQALVKGDIATATTLIARLSAPKAETYAPWRQRAEARVKAGEAIAKLQIDALSALAKASASAAKQ